MVGGTKYPLIFLPATNGLRTNTHNHHTTQATTEEHTLRTPANDTVRTTATGRPYRTVRKLTEYVGSTKARYADIALAVLPSEVAA